MLKLFSRKNAREAAYALGIDINQRFSEETLSDFADGDIIFNEGDDSREMYVVVQGQVSVSKRSAQGDIPLAMLKKGDFVGEMSLLESLPRSATARAHGKTRLLAIHPGGFLLKIRRDPTFAFEMMQALSRRIRMTNENLMRELNRSTTTVDSIRAVLQGAEFSAESKKIATSIQCPVVDLKKTGTSQT